MSPVLAAALARAEAAGAVLARAEAADAVPAVDDGDASPCARDALARAEAADFLAVDAALAGDASPCARDAAPPRRESKTPGRFSTLSGFLGHSTPRGEGRRS